MRKILYCLFFFFTAFFFCLQISRAQEKQYKTGCVAFYNLENLYDTINDPEKNDDEFTPEGTAKWVSKRYFEKLDHLAYVISQIGDEYVKGGPVVMGVSEVENKNVVEDLINRPALKASGYGIVHYDSPDLRGVDVAFIYQKQHFTVTGSKNVKLSLPSLPDWKTRDQLVVAGLFDGEQMYFIVNHWPSRRGGEKRSAALRIAAANLTKSIVDSIHRIDSVAKIIIMGDFNDDPVNKSIKNHLMAKGDKKDVAAEELFNPMFKMFKKYGLGSLAYRDNWNLFDQIIVSGALLGADKSTYKFLQAKVFNRNFLTQKEGNFSGYPFRTYVGGNYLGGYSDHFPVYIFLAREK